MFAWAGDIDGCSYYRCVLPHHALAATGHQARVSTDLPVDGGDWDVIIGQRVVRPDSSRVWRSLTGRRLVYEVDDDLWSIPPVNPAHAFYDSARLELAAANIAAADAVTTTTEPLAEVLSRWNPRVTVIPNFIDAALLQVQRPARRQVTIGWAGSHSHRDDMRAAAKPLRRLFRSRRTVGLHMIGADLRRMVGCPDGRHTRWARPVQSYYQLIDFDIGIAPLQHNRFNESKSPIKALEYAALGIPVIASNVGPYRSFVQHGITGFLCDTERDWDEALRALTGDRELRERMGAAAKVQAAGWTIQGNADRWASFISCV